MDDEYTDDVNYQHVEAIQWDQHRHCLWILSRGILYQYQVTKTDDIHSNMLRVPEVYAWPPGIASLCVSFVGITGIFIRKHPMDRSHPHHGSSIGIDSHAHNLWITMGTKTICHYNPESGHSKLIVPHTDHHWRTISSSDINGWFIISTGSDYTMAYWDGTDWRDAEGYHEHYILINCFWQKHLRVVSTSIDPEYKAFYVLCRNMTWVIDDRGNRIHPTDGWKLFLLRTEGRVTEQQEIPQTESTLINGDGIDDPWYLASVLCYGRDYSIRNSTDTIEWKTDQPTSYTNVVCSGRVNGDMFAFAVYSLPITDEHPYLTSRIRAVPLSSLCTMNI
jgi:hypothetical protein